MTEDEVWQIVRFPQHAMASDRRAAANWLMERIRQRTADLHNEVTPLILALQVLNEAGPPG